MLKLEMCLEKKNIYTNMDLVSSVLKFYTVNGEVMECAEPHTGSPTVTYGSVMLIFMCGFLLKRSIFNIRVRVREQNPLLS